MPMPALHSCIHVVRYERGMMRKNERTVVPDEGEDLGQAFLPLSHNGSSAKHCCKTAS